MSSPSVKTCVVCGTNCANTPRVKDPRGRYFCKPCYEEALKRKKGTASDSRQSQRDEIDLEGEDREDRSPTAGWGGSLLDDAPDRAGSCPECGAALEEGAVLCVNCGYMLSAGKHITPKVEADDDEVDAPPIAGEAPQQTKWPIVIGVISLIFAFFGALIYGVASVGAALTSPEDAGGPLLWALGLVLNPILLALSIGLGLGAIALVQRRQAAAKWLRWWAWGKIIVVGAMLAPYALMLTMSVADLGEALGPTAAGLGAAAAVLVLLPVLIWLLFWPVFLLLWLRRQTIKEEVAQWR